MIELRGVAAADPGADTDVLTPEALAFLEVLHRGFDARRRVLLEERAAQRRALAAGSPLTFSAATADIRADPSWRVAEPAPGLLDRRVEITGPTDRKMTVNALNSGARVWLADFEDASTPHWRNVIDGQRNLARALDRTIDFDDDNGKAYRLGSDPATIVVRPRGLHLEEKHLRVDGAAMSASLVDFGLYFFHCARRQLERGSGPYYYLPKLEHAAEARFWNDVFLAAQDAVGVPPGTIRATVLIETITAAFEMEEILYELREHSAGLNAGRWDYLFSLIKNFGRGRDEMILPDRASVTMEAPLMRAYAQLLVDTCHRRGAHAIGGMAAMIPNRRDPQANERALSQVRADKQREASTGFDGSWVAHPDLVPVCRSVFDAALADAPHQIHHTRSVIEVRAEDLLDVASAGTRRTSAGLRHDVAVSLRYLEAWFHGTGAVALFGLMEDTATAEISRSLIWQWIANDVVLDDGSPVTVELVQRMVEQEREIVASESGPERVASAEWLRAESLFTELIAATTIEEFLTIPAYRSVP